MDGVDNHPRVLLVFMPKVMADDPANLIIRMQFAGWPTEKLAQIHSSDTPGRGEFCGRYHRLGAADRFLGGLFLRLRSQVSGMVSMQAVAPSAPATSAASGPLRRWSQGLGRRLGQFLIDSGLWELVFPLRLSAEMERFVRDFRPEVIYCSGYSLGFATLPLRISRRFGVPICFQTLEDWPGYTYARSPVGLLVRRAANRLVRAASLRLAFGQKMKAVFERRYGVPFHVTYHLDDLRRFDAALALPTPPSPVRRVVFTGSLVLQRHECIADLLQAVRLLARDGIRVEVAVHCTGIPREMPEEVRSAPEVRFLPLPGHDDLPAVLRGADVLFLPESFSVDEARLGLAISTKCHLYMMAGRPILVYGPEYGGTMAYAREGGWGLLVEERDPLRLAAGLRTLLAGGPAVEALHERARACFMKNHDQSAARERFERWMRESVVAGAEGAHGGT